MGLEIFVHNVLDFVVSVVVEKACCTAVAVVGLLDLNQTAV